MKVRFALYARYSSDLQSERSIDDQLRLCREFAAKAGGTVAAEFTDAALSGADLVNRPGIRALLAAASRGEFDAVLAEALDRLSRDQEHIAALYKRLTFAGVRLVTVAEQDVSELHIGLKGTMNALFLKDLAAKIRRGQRGRVEAGFVPAGLAYGYEAVREIGPDGEPVRGKRLIVAREAAVVRRIFAEYASGKSARAIAHDLNREEIPSPRGGEWSVGTLMGHLGRGNGILFNPIYAGRIVWNRRRMVKDPVTEKRVWRANPKETWAVKDCPELRIIADDLWERVQATGRRAAAHPKRRGGGAHTLLSGLVFCGLCGAPYVSKGKGRAICKTRLRSRSCANIRSIVVKTLEDRVFAGLRAKMLAPEAVAEFIREYQAEWKRRTRGRNRRRREAAVELREVTAQIEKMVDAIADGAKFAPIKDRFAALDRRRIALEAALAAEDPPLVVEVHPRLAEAYAAKVADLKSSLNADDGTRREAAEALRAHIEKVVIYPTERRGCWRSELHGRLDAILAEASGRNRRGTFFGADLVAEEGFEPPTHGL